ncbi:AAA family ATPase [Agromyces sp. SYSU T00194]|uniref:AAA family ATPase n=1 Tax=Agromyces chitinivorans TaxID=3158560 RepID=UPI003394E88A
MQVTLNTAAAVSQAPPTPEIGYSDALRIYTEAGSAEVLRPIPVADTPPRGYRSWTPEAAERWAKSEHWEFARTASSPAPGYVFLDDDDAPACAALEAQLGARPGTLYTTSRGVLSAAQGRAKRLYRVPADVSLADRYSGGEVVDHFHRFAFVGPTRNHRTLDTEVWYLPDGTALEGPPTAQDIAEHVAELPSAWLTHLQRPARETGEIPAWEGPQSFDAGEVAPWLQELSEQWSGVERYPNAQSALWSLAWIAVLLPETPGIDTLRHEISDAYVNRPDTNTPPSERQARMDRLWEGALPKQAEALRTLETEFGRSAVRWATSTLSARAPEPSERERLESLTPEQAEAEFGWDWENLRAQALTRAEASETQAAIPETWKPLDLAEFLAEDYAPPAPSVFRRTDGMGLFYPGVVNEVHAPGGEGKTLFALAVAAEQLADGHTVAHIDYEEHPGRIVSRLVGLGVDRAVIAERFHYIRPEERPTPAVLEAYARRGYSLVIIDTVGESINNVTGGDSNSTDDVTRWHSFARSFAQAGACVLVVDHVPKDAANPLFPIGSQAKYAGYKGAIYLLETPRGGGLKKGGTGFLSMKLAKDNGGGLGLRKGELAAEFHLDSTASPSLWELRHPSASAQVARAASTALTLQGEILSVVTAAEGPINHKAAREALGLSGNNWGKYREALKSLIDDGRLVETQGQKGSKILSLPTTSPVSFPASRSLGPGEAGEAPSLGSPASPSFPELPRFGYGEAGNPLRSQQWRGSSPSRRDPSGSGSPFRDGEAALQGSGGSPGPEGDPRRQLEKEST